MNLLRIIPFIAVLFFFSCRSQPKGPKESNPVLTKPPIDTLTLAIQKSPTADNYYNRGVRLHRIDQDSLAINDFRKAISIDSSKSRYYSAIGNILFEHKDLTGSVVWLKGALARDPADVQAHLKLAKAMLFIKDYKTAFEEINTVLRRDAYNPEGYYLKGLIYKDMDSVSRAISSFATAVSVDPNYKDAVIQIGQIYLAKDNPEGLQYLDKAYRMDTTDVFPLYARGQYFQKKGQVEDAKQEYNRAILRDRNYYDAYFANGYILLQQDSFEKAQRQFDLVTKVDPTNAGAYYNRGLCSELMGNKPAARQDYNQALEFNKDYKQAKEALQRVKG